ncbi:DUF1127 domain-containing protein [Pontibaca sp. S1109L]|uniref:DUF1127 domain-containing protein n=2 Tax=Pontibaca salina TaxID=2795731 RepID=A0A934HQK4_9RHOB|nr:DUF1127 domain-containing protein [Pontibaca salina]
MSDAAFSDTTRGGVIGRVLGAFQSLQRRFVDYRRFQQTVNELSVLNDRVLRDLGLERSSLKWAAHQAVYQDHR